MSQKERSCPHCGGILTKPRSGPDHRRFFALIHAAYDQWPEAHEFQPDSTEHLRRWLTCKAGYRESTPIMLEDDATEHMVTLFRLAVEAAVAAAGGSAFVVPYKHGVAIIKPKSIAFDKIGQREFADVRSRIEEVIEAETGISAERMLQEAEKAA